MNSVEPAGQVAPDAGRPTDGTPAPSNGLFIGDAGVLPLDTRRALVQLLSGPSLEARRHAKLWPVLLRDESILRSRLSDLFLELVLDRELQVAFTRQADVGEIEAPVLLRRAPLTFIDSVLVLHLRQRLIEADTQGERAVVATSEIIEFLSVYERAASTDRAGFAKRVQASIEKIKKHSILQKIRGSDDRFEISPTLKLLFSADEISTLARLYRQMAEGAMPGQAAVSESDEGDEV
jgi:hypothetical protein